MPTPSSGPISFLNLKNTFGVSGAVSMAQLYRGGTYVPNLGAGRANGTIPTTLSGLSLLKFRNGWGNKIRSFTMNVGVASGKKKGSLYGFGPTFGSIVGGAPTFISPVGQLTLVSLYYNAGNQRWYMTLGSATTIPATLEPFKSIAITGYAIGGVLALTTTTSANGNTRTWSWPAATTAHPVSGTVACSLRYYG
jgi:hypothetical protein